MRLSDGQFFENSLTSRRYVGALPLALGVRSTNVYEDRSIALYEQRDDDEEPSALRSGLSKTQVWGEYMVSDGRLVCMFGVIASDDLF